MERQTALVIDASIVVKWFVPETDSTDALKIRDDHVNGEVSLFAPDLLTYELANALRYRTSITDNDLRKSIESIFQLDLALIGPTTESISRTAMLARSLDISIYDACYLELAQSLECQVITSDKSFCDRVRTGLDDESRIELLEGYMRQKIRN